MILDRVPRMPRITIGKYLPVSAKCLKAQVNETITAQNAVITAVFHLLGQHPLHFFIAQRAVAIIEPAIRVAVQRIGGEINRALLARSTRNLNNEDGPAFQRHFTNVRVSQQIDANLVAIVQRIKQLLAHLGDIHNAFNRKLPLLLAQAKHHHPALRVGKSAIGRPEILRNRALPITASGEFAFQIH